MSVVIKYDREELFDELLEAIDGSESEEYDFLSCFNPIVTAILQSGSYKYAQKMFIAGVYSAPSSYYAQKVCTQEGDLQDSIDFLDFLLVQREEVDATESTYLKIDQTITTFPITYIPLIEVLFGGGKLARSSRIELVGILLVLVLILVLMRCI